MNLNKQIWFFALWMTAYLTYLLALFHNYLRSIEIAAGYNLFLFSLVSFALMLVAGIMLLRLRRYGVLVGLSLAFMAFALFIIWR